MSSPCKASGPTLGETPYRKLPNFYRTTIQLSTLLDVEQPLGDNDYRTVLELLGFSPEEVRFWGCKCKRPTLEALSEWEGTVQELTVALRECERFDALSVLVQALVETLQDRHQSSSKQSANILTQGCSNPPVILPTPVKFGKVETCSADSADKSAVGDATPMMACAETTLVEDHQAPSSLLKSSDWGISLASGDDATTTMASMATAQVEDHRAPSSSPLLPTTAWGIPLANGDDAMVKPSRPITELDDLLKSHFQIPMQLALATLSSSTGRATTEYVCNLVASTVSHCRCMSNSGDLTWISNTTVYVNNFARVFLMLVASINLVTCVFGAYHTPTYILELIIAAIPVVQSLYVEQNLPIYRDLVRKIKDMEAGMTLIARALERGPGKSATSETNVLNELEERKRKLNHLKVLVMPAYSDIRLCIISTLLIEVLLLFLVVSVGLMFLTGEEILERCQDGFTLLALVLMCVDGTYNFALVTVYYHDRTIETILRKDRFRLDTSLFRQESDSV